MENQHDIGKSPVSMGDTSSNDSFWGYTLPKTNIFAPENGWLEDDISFWGGSVLGVSAYFSGVLAVSFGEGYDIARVKHHQVSPKRNALVFSHPNHSLQLGVLLPLGCGWKQ